MRVVSQGMPSSELVSGGELRAAERCLFPQLTLAVCTDQRQWFPSAEDWATNTIGARNACHAHAHPHSAAYASRAQSNTL
jgi:hypothetical protein